MTDEDPTRRPSGSPRGADREALRRAANRALGAGPDSDRRRDQVEGAVALVERMLRAWPLRDPLLWVEELVVLEVGRAGTAVQRLIHEHSTPPSIAAFFELYRSLDTTLPTAVVGAHCTRRDGHGCDDTGWIESMPFTSHGHTYSSMEPCPDCAEGDARRRSTIWRERGAG